jgi:hypothetical protein
MDANSEPIDRALRRLPSPWTFVHGGRDIVIVCLIRESDWRPLKAPWWRGKEVYVIGADVDGNFLLRHSDGTVRYWHHQTQTDEVLARSVREFASALASAV